MKFSLYLLAGIVGCLHAAPTGPASDGSAAFIVKLRPSVKPARVQSFLSSFTSSSGSDSMTHDGAVNSITYEYDFGTFTGVAGTFTPDFHAFLQQQPEVEYIEEDGEVETWGEQAKPPSWGMTRVSQRKLDLSQPYVYPDEAGEGVDAYIIDTGIDPAHSDFGGRAKMAASFVQESNPNDGNGHGTHVAGTIGSNTYGLAKKVNLFGVKVLSSQGSGTYSGVIAGIEYVAKQAKPGKTVANMSLGGGKSQAVNDAVDAAVKAGVVMIVAAGNSAADTCNFSPAGAPLAFAVGSSDKTDAMSSFSNRGKCVKLFAPGRDITSTWIGGNGATKTISGTSMASPHVAGVAALYMSQKDYKDAKSVYDDLVGASTPNVITGLDGTTPNKMVFNKAGTGGEDVPQEPEPAVAA